jgi:DNA-binding CsgD family transcriptional regulator
VPFKRAIGGKIRDRIHQLWDELADFHASGEEDALNHALAVLTGVVQAQNAYWLGAVRLSSSHPHDPLRGWRPRAIHYLHPSSVDARFYERASRDLEAGHVDESTRAHVLASGTFRAVLLRELVSREWFDSAFYELAYTARGMSDAVFVVSPVNRSVESYFVFLRKAGAKPFTPRDRDLLAYALRPLRSFHRQMLLSRGLMVAHMPLTPMERRVTRLLLTDLSEKEIALRLELTPRTVHSYVTQIFRKFGVNGRPGLTALWLGR